MKVLFDVGYNHTQRMKDILEQKIAPTRDDILELWEVYVDGAISYCGVAPSVIDFGQWISGSGEYAADAEYGGGACVVTW